MNVAKFLKSPRLSVVFLLVTVISTSSAIAQQNSRKTVQRVAGPNNQQRQQLRQKGIDFLKNTQDHEKGYWTTPNAPGITALITTAFIRSGVPRDDPAVQKALEFLESNIQKNGGIYFSRSNHRNYETCIALTTFSLANKDGKYDKVISGAQKFLRKLQWDEGEGLESNDTNYGGAGYGKHQRPDMSNTQFLIDALRSSGVKSNDPAIRKALIFVSRSQNLESEFNTTKFAAKIGDGGFYYTPSAGGETKAKVTANGGLSSYASMTYAGIKSMIYAGLTKKDKRVRAAFEWIQKNYTLEHNPGVGKQGLFYYYHTFAKALSVMDVNFIEDDKGKRHDWRKELIQKLAQRQRGNGSWVNKTSRWSEGDPHLVTAYALLALSYCEKK